ncbi:hypothetical protein [Parashewanella tropica]|uniref:hypothetical protein n=1 Tax=Parashewanella tropica TaxID=2547970 RepID=UPI0010594756|nr:hypothetical protein [Parashewanella tropica]
MLTIDSSAKFALSVDDVCQMSRHQLSNPKAFKQFHQGVELNPNVLLSERWSNINSGVSQSLAHTVNYIMLEMLPNFYSLEELEKQGGVIGFQVLNVGSYTLYSLNQRVVVLNGLPFNIETQKPNIDIAITADIFIAYLRGLLLSISDDLLDSDDENEDRELTNTELQLYGMPAGGIDSFIGGPDSFGAMSPGIAGGIGASVRDELVAEACSIDKAVGSHCVADADACGRNFKAGSLCTVDSDACGSDTAIGTVCANDAGACGANVEAAHACNGDASVCGGHASAAEACIGNVGGCAADANAASACAGNADACGGHAGAANACAGDADACAAAAMAGDLCGGKAGACAADAGTGTCGANADACAVNTLELCGGHAGVCAVDVDDGDIVSCCAINVIPLLPSC